MTEESTETQTPLDILMAGQSEQEPEEAPAVLEAEEPSLDAPEASPDEPAEEQADPEPEREKGDFTDLYDKVVPGTDMTLSELKDAAKEFKTVSELSEKVDAQSSELERQRLEVTQQLKAVASTLPQEALTPQALEAAQAQLTAHKQATAEQIATMLPDWAVPETKAAEVNLIKDNLKAYGIEPAMVDSVLETDAVLTKVLLDKARSDKRQADVVKDLKSNKRKQGPRKARKLHGSQTDKIVNAAKAGTANKDDAVAALLLSSMSEN